VCPGTPCTTTQPVASGSRISGVPRHQGKVRLSWAPASWNVAMELVASSTIVVTDAGDWAVTQAAIQTDHAPGYGVVNADIGYDWRLEHNQLRSFVRVENLFDRRYVGSVIVNEANNRFFESGPGRTLMAGVQWSWR
jgi:iron complex outermembrane receptor protein